MLKKFFLYFKFNGKTLSINLFFSLQQKFRHSNYNDAPVKEEERIPLEAKK